MDYEIDSLKKIIQTLLSENKRLKEDNELLYSDNERLRDRVKVLETSEVSDLLSERDRLPPR